MNLRISPCEIQMAEKWVKHKSPGLKSRGRQKPESKILFFLEKRRHRKVVAGYINSEIVGDVPRTVSEKVRTLKIVQGSFFHQCKTKQCWFMFRPFLLFFIRPIESADQNSQQPSKIFFVLKFFKLGASSRFLICLSYWFCFSKWTRPRQVQGGPKLVLENFSRAHLRKLSQFRKLRHNTKEGNNFRTNTTRPTTGTANKNKMKVWSTCYLFLLHCRILICDELFVQNS